MLNWIKSHKVLTARQLKRVKTSFALLAVVVSAQMCAVVANYYYEGEEFEKMSITYFPRGRIVEYTNLEEFCHR